MYAHKNSLEKTFINRIFKACFERYLIKTKHVDVNHQSLLNVVATHYH